jgi:hypothetical protein
LITFLIQSIKIIEIISFLNESLSNILWSFQLNLDSHIVFTIILQMSIQSEKQKRVSNLPYIACHSNRHLKYLIFLMLGNVPQFLTWLKVIDLLIVFEEHFWLLSHFLSLLNHFVITANAFLFKPKIDSTYYLLFIIMSPCDPIPFRLFIITIDNTSLPNELTIIIIPFAISLYITIFSLNLS